MRHVEFLGAPGSGKTTVMRQTIETLRADGQPAISLEDAILRSIRDEGRDGMARVAARLARSGSSRMWRRAYARSTDRFDALSRFMSTRPRLMEMVLTSQRGRADRDLDQDLVLRWLVNLMAGFQLATENASDTDLILIDEGFCQRAVALFGRGFEPDDETHLREYLELIPRPNFVVLVDTPIEICAQRLDARGWSERVAGLPTEERLHFLDTSAAVVQLVSEQAETANTRLLRVDGTDPATTSAATIARLLEI